MNCRHIIERIPEWIDQTLSAEDATMVGQHLADCHACRAEFRAYSKTWNALKTWPDIEPDAGYVARFWTRLSLRKPWYQRLLEAIISLWAKQRLVPTMVMTFFLIFLMSVTLYRTYFVVKTEKLMSSLTIDDIEFVENIELVENFDVIENMDFLDDLNVIENLPDLKV